MKIAYPGQKQKRNLRNQLIKYLFSSLLLTCLCLSLGTGISMSQPVEDSTLEKILQQGNFSEAIRAIEQDWKADYQEYFSTTFLNSLQTGEQIAKSISAIAIETKTNPAVIWMLPRSQQLELLLVTPGKAPIYQSIPEANQEILLQTVKELTQEITSPHKTRRISYLTPSQKLYQWMIAPLSPFLEAEKIDTLLFCVGGGLRTFPWATLHDGKQFLVEKYNLALIPAFSLIEHRYIDIRQAKILAMGASEFTNLNPLPAVPIELSTITQKGQGNAFLNQEFTLENLQTQRRKEHYKIVHLATHAEFQPGVPQNSFIQLWQSQINLAQIKQLGWNNPPVELLVLSACRTALGDKDAELGFAGLTVQAGVKSALASLWYVSDAGTLALMSEFYQQLKTAKIKSEALRKAQIAMIQGKVKLTQGKLESSRGGMLLPLSLAEIGEPNLKHPYYWAAFTAIGSPW
jgi:CHAT domain-containing protein